MSLERPTLDTLVEEAKTEKGPEVDWSKVEAKLFPRVEREARAQAALGVYAGPHRSWVAAAIVIAAAAAVPLAFHRAETGALEGGRVAAARTSLAGSMLEKDRNAVVHATGAASRDLSKGDAIAQGDVLDARSGRAVFTRAEPRGVTWALEDNSQVEIRAAGSTLVLALLKGTVEAQVTPVASGEAFAIDVEGSRVAVHGTHLRVERQSGHAVVDLREGVVSIGAPPRSGSTYGDLVTAPAHIEFDPADPHGTLKVSHELSRVRAAQNLAAPPPANTTETAAVSRALHVPVAPVVPVLPAPPAAPAVAAAPSPVPRASAPPATAPPAVPPAPAAPAPPAMVSSPVPPPPAPAQVDRDPERTIVDQVRACARKHVEPSDGVVITVSSRLELRVSDSGMVSAAVFNPPLAPEVQACAATAIYGTRFAQPGAVSIAIDVTP